MIVFVANAMEPLPFSEGIQGLSGWSEWIMGIVGGEGKGITSVHSEWTVEEWVWCLFVSQLFLLFIWLFWKGESENERNENG